MATTTVDNRRETVSLIGSDKVEGTPVYGRDDNKIGTVQRVMLDKISGKVAYAVISFGGFLGMGEDYFPMPWASLKYDTGLGGYRVGITEDQLNNAPRFNRSTDWIGPTERGIVLYTTTTRPRFGTNEPAQHPARHGAGCRASERPEPRSALPKPERA